MPRGLFLPTLLFLTLTACGRQHAPTPLPETQAATPPDAHLARGEHVFNNVCSACHGMGVAGAPKAGDKALWAPRIAQGKDVLYRHALDGFTGQSGTMPPRGGNPQLSDADVRAGVDYLVSLAGAGGK
jgi:cytochrome c5